MDSLQFIAQLSSVRRRLRALLVVDGVARLLLTSIAVIASLGALDWWVHFPSGIRFVFLIGLATWCIRWAHKRIWKPLTSPIPLDQLALALPVLTPELRDRLAGSVAYSLGRGHGSDDLWKGMVSETAQDLSGRTLDSALSARRPAWSSLFVACVLTAVATAVARMPEMVAVGLRRIAQPFALVEWPRNVQIDMSENAAFVAHGESFTARMRLARGDDATLRAYVSWRIGTRQVERALMRRDPDGCYRRVIENITDDLTFSFTAGDDGTADRPCRARVVHRPAVATAKFVFTPPDYAKHMPQREQFLVDARASTVRGTLARLEVTADKCLATREHGNSRIVFDGGREVAMAIMDGQRRSASAELEADQTCTFDVVLVDELGFESRGGPRYQLEVTADQPPTVAIKDPTAPIDVLPQAVVPVSVLAQDDMGLVEFNLLASVRGGAWGQIADLLSEGAGGRGRFVFQVALDYPWDLTTLRLSAGDVVDYAVQARDSYAFKGETHKPVRSATLRFNVVSADQFLERMRQDLTALRNPLRKLVTDLQTLRTQTESLANKADPQLDETDQLQAERLIDAFRRWMFAGREALARFERITKRANTNHVDQSEPAAQAQRLGRKLAAAIEDPVRRAVEDFATVTEMRGVARHREKLMDSAAAQDEAVASLRSLLDELERWDSFDEIVRKLQEELDRQEALARDLANVTKSGEFMVTALLDRLATEQNLLTTETQKMLVGIDQLVKDLRAKDQAASDSLERAHQVANQRGLIQVMTGAASAIGAGRFVEAGQAQEQAGSVLRAMLVALNEKPRRELEQLSRHVQDARQRLSRLITAQEDLIQRNRTARSAEDAPTKLPELAERQSSVESTSRTLSGRLNVSGTEAEEAKDDILAAAVQMNAAATALRDAAGIEAEDSQKGAVENLQAAMSALGKLDEKTTAALAERSMSAIVDSLRAILHSQTRIRDESSGISTRGRDRTAISRADGLAMNRLAREQQGLLEPLGEVREKIGQAMMYVFVCEQISAAMNASAGHLAAHDCAASIIQQEIILRQLKRLIDVAEEPPANDATQFASEEGGGGGANKPSATNPVPALAELKLLRIIQVDLNGQTTALHAAMPEPMERGEEQLKQIGRLGEEQRRVHELAIKMIQKSHAGATK